jgi:hypothetical protein
MSDDWALHLVQVRTRSGVWEAQRRLKEHGYYPTIIWGQPPAFPHQLKFNAPPDEKLDFLRPDIIPPRRENE